MYAFQISGDRPSHTVMLSVLAYESHSLGDGDPCKVCLKILPVSFDFVCILLRIHVLLTGLPFHFLKYIFSPTVTFWTVPVVTQLLTEAAILYCMHIFPDIPGWFIPVTFLFWHHKFSTFA